MAISLREGKLQTVFDPNPQFAASELDRVEKIEWHDAFGNPTIVQYRSKGFLHGGRRAGENQPRTNRRCLYRSITWSRVSSLAGHNVMLVAEEDGHSAATMLKTYAGLKSASLSKLVNNVIAFAKPPG